MAVSRIISDKLRFMLEEVRQVYGEYKSVHGRMTETILKTYNQCLSEGLTPFEAKDLILAVTDPSLHRNIRRILPDECKDQYMQQLAAKRKALPIGKDGLLKKLTSESSSLPHPVDSPSESDIFIKELRAGLDNRELSLKVYHESHILDSKGKIIEEKDKTIQELKKRIELNNNFGGEWLILPFEPAEYICKIFCRNTIDQIESKFSLAHDGYRIIKVEDLSS